MTLGEEFRKLQKSNIENARKSYLSDEEIYVKSINSLYVDIIKRIKWEVENQLSKKAGQMEGRISVQNTFSDSKNLPHGRETKYLKYDELTQNTYFRPYFNTNANSIFIKKGFLSGKEEKTKIVVSFTETGIRVATDLKQMLNKEGISATFGYSLSGYCYESFSIGSGKIAIGATTEYISDEKRSECGTIRSGMELFYKI